MKRINFWVGMIIRATSRIYVRKRYIKTTLELLDFCKQRLITAIEDYTALECEKAQEWVVQDYWAEVFKRQQEDKLIREYLLKKAKAEVENEIL